jgi:glycosyltransferase involved in cell wall biosynthesis
VIAGAKPPAELLEFGSSDVQITGYVKDLDAYYREAWCVIAPLFSVGGLKFKVPQAMRYGLPVIATTAALQGLEDLPADAVLGPTDAAQEFARLVTLALGGSPVAQLAADTGKEWVLQKYDFSSMVSQIVGELQKRRLR